MRPETRNLNLVYFAYPYALDQLILRHLTAALDVKLLRAVVELRYETLMTRPNEKGEARHVLIDQLAYLIDEAEALKPQLDLIPESVQTGRPLESAPSFKEIYTVLAYLDDRIYAPALEQLTKGTEATIEIPDTPSLLERSREMDKNIEGVVEEVREARTKLVSLLRSLTLDDWEKRVVIDGKETDVFGLAYGIAQHDATLQKAAAHRLHESRLTSREQDLPK